MKRSKWENAKYLIDAKKDIDSILFLAEYGKEISNLNLKEKTDSLLKHFYITLRILYDELPNAKKKSLRETDSIYMSTLYECDKNQAHKDIANLIIQIEEIQKTLI